LIRSFQDGVSPNTMSSDVAGTSIAESHIDGMFESRVIAQARTTLPGA
jgi:hypothetical protein